jgi:hypothetical protein
VTCKIAVGHSFSFFSILTWLNYPIVARLVVAKLENLKVAGFYPEAFSLGRPPAYNNFCNLFSDAFP